MMTSISRKLFNTLPSHKLLSIVFSLIICVFISACDGGISGTGAGGPIIVQPPAQNMTDAADASNGAINGGGDGGGETAGPTNGESDVNASPDNGTPNTDSPVTESPVSDSGRFPTPNLSQLIPASIIELNNRNEGTSVADAFATQLITAQQQLVAALTAIAGDQPLAAEPVASSWNNAQRFSQGDLDVVVSWDSTNGHSYLFVSNNEHAISLLQQDAVVTLRHLDFAKNSLLQAIVITQAGNTTTLEADLNQNGSQAYLQGLSDGMGATIFSQHPTDSSVTRIRELIDANGVVTISESCTAAAQDCNTVNSWNGATEQTDMLFSNTQREIDGVLATVATPVDALPVGVNEAILVAPSGGQLTDLVNGNTQTDTTPAENQIHCGLQQVSDDVRAYCVRPLPLSDDTLLYGESLAGGEIFYQLLP